MGQTSQTAPGVGNTTTGFAVGGSTGYIAASRASGTVMFLNRNSDGDLLNFNSSGVATYQLGLSSGALTFNNTSERMRLDASGNLLVGTTSSVRGTPKFQSVNASDTSALFQCGNNASNNIISWMNTASGTRYHMAFGDGTTYTERGSISTDGTATAYNTSSDYRLKNITGPITTSGAYIDSLKPVEGTWKSSGATFVGLIAHETQEASRTTVATGTKDGEQMQGMDYSSAEIIANLIAELQDLRKRLAAAGIA